MAAAEQAYRRVIAIAPDSAEAHHMLGILAFQTGRAEAGIVSLRTAITLQPDTVEFANNLGNMLRDTGRHTEAVATYSRALAAAPGHPELHANLGKALASLGRTAEAEAALRRTLQAAPTHVDALTDLGNLLCDLDRAGEAADCLAAALRLRPNDAKLQNNLGRALSAQQRFDDAAAHFRAALRADPGYTKAWFNLGKLLATLRRWDEADSCWRRVLECSPEDAETHVARGEMLLSIGRLEEGWPEQQWFRELRRQQPNEIGMAFPPATWRGEEVGDGALVLYADQGLGDAIQFCRYVPLCAQRASVYLLVPPSLHRLFMQFADIATVLSEPALPDSYLHCPLTGLPQVFATGLHSIPATVPYFRAEPARAGLWRSRLANLPGRRVGVVWAGNPRYPADRIRSLPLASLAACFDLPGVSLVSLQKGAATAQIQDLERPDVLYDVMDEVADFADTAALIDALDLVIGVDTSVIHLAGALGKPVWLLNRHDSDWRWLLDREDSPWYPTLRQFRQAVAGDWMQPLQCARDALQRLVAGNRSELLPTPGIAPPGAA